MSGPLPRRVGGVPDWWRRGRGSSDGPLFRRWRGVGTPAGGFPPGLAMVRREASPGFAWASGAALILSAAVFLLSGCAASRSSLSGAFQGAPSPAPAQVARAERVSVAFIFTHVHQNKGWDVIPKLHHQDRYAHGFYELFRDALPTLTNLGAYATFTDRAEDVTDPKRQAERDSLAVGSHDFTVNMRFLRETSFPREALGTIASVVTVTTIPVPYARHYSLTAQVTDRSGRLLKTYRREATVTQWVQALLVFVYPFHPETRKTDEVYLEFLKDVFREMEADGVLRRGPAQEGPAAPAVEPLLREMSQVPVPLPPRRRGP